MDKPLALENKRQCQEQTKPFCGEGHVGSWGVMGRASVPCCGCQYTVR